MCYNYIILPTIYYIKSPAITLRCPSNGGGGEGLNQKYDFFSLKKVNIW